MIGNIRIRERRSPMRALLRVEGRILGGAAAGRLLARVRRALSGGARVLVLDLSGVAAIDGGGIGMLLACWRAARQRNATLLVRRARGPARRTLELSALLGPLEGGLPGPGGRRGPDALLLQPV